MIKPNIKSSKHAIKFANQGKLYAYQDFLGEYKDAIKFFVNYLFNNEVIYNDKIFSIKKDLLNCPQFFSIKLINHSFSLSQRALSCAATQACGIVSAACEKRKRLLFVLNKLRSNKERTRRITKKLNKTKVIFPDLKNINAELNSICCRLEKSTTNEFDYWMILSSIGDKYGKIIIPIKSTKHSNKFEKYEKKKSFLFSNNKINIRYEITKKELKTKGKVVGADSGLNTCLTLSDRQVTKKNNHGHDLKSICVKISNKERGSKAYKKALEHRKNYINWSINQINLSGIKQINLEDISKIKYKQRTSKLLNSWTYTTIRNKLIDKATEQGVLVRLQSSPYRSQRCSKCGYVHNKNRIKEKFSCKHCNFNCNADLNASLNHELELYPIKFKLGQLNRKGFFWKEEGLFDLVGQEFIVPVTN